MTMLMTLEAIRKNVETSLADEALQVLIDEADAQIIKRFGPHTGDIEEVFEARHRARHGRVYEDRNTSAYIHLRRIAESVASVIEDGETLTVDEDYEVVSSGRAIVRVKNRNVWKRPVTVMYTPQDDTYIRRGVLVDLVKLAVDFDAARARSIGGMNVSYGDFDKMQMMVLRRLQRQRPREMFV